MEKTMRILANIFNLAVLAVMIVYLGIFMIAEDIELFIIESPLVFAFLVAIAILVLVTINIWDETKKARGISAAGEKRESKLAKEELSQLKTIGFFTLGFVVYVMLIRYLHFLLGSFIFMTLAMFMLNDVQKKFGGRILRAGLASLVTVPILYLIFNVVFKVMLP